MFILAGYKHWGNQHKIFIGRTDAKTEAPILWELDAKRWLIGKDPDAGKDRRKREKGMTEYEMVGWYHCLMSLTKLWEIVKGRETWHAAVLGITKSRTWISNWTTTKKKHWVITNIKTFWTENQHDSWKVSTSACIQKIEKEKLAFLQTQQTLENSERDGNTRPPDLPLEKSVCRSGSNS